MEPGLELYHLVRLCPVMVLGKRIAITAFDAGPLQLTPEEITCGWVEKESVAYSPLITEHLEIPIAEWDEWYVNVEIGAARGTQVFVTDPTFSLKFDSSPHSNREQLWRQLSRILPEIYLFSNDARTVIVTRNYSMFQMLKQIVQNEVDNWSEGVHPFLEL